MRVSTLFILLLIACFLVIWLAPGLVGPASIGVMICTFGYLISQWLEELV